MVPLEDKFKFVDDLSILEIIDLLNIGIASYNIKQHVPNDIPLHNQFIPAVNLKSQKWLNEINDWTTKNKMLINEKKTKAMIFNFTQNYQFGTRLQLKDVNIEVISQTKLLGTIFTDDLKWDANTANIVRKANISMELLRHVSSFGAPIEDLKQIYMVFIRSLLEQSAVVWHSSLSEENKDDLERVQKSAFKIILGHEYRNYENAMKKLNLTTLDERRQDLCLNFALKCLKNPKTNNMFCENVSQSHMKLRKHEKYKVQFAKTERLKRSPLIYMQGLLNQNEFK